MLARRGRTALTLTGLVLACTFLTASLALARGVDAALEATATRSFLSGEVILQSGVQRPSALANAIPLAGVLENDNPNAALDDALLVRLRALPGVVRVVPQMAFPYPVTARIDIFDMHFEVDLPLFVVDDAFFVSLGGEAPKKGENDILISQRLLDIYNLGLATGSDLPRLRPEGLIGLTFDAELGFSSFLQTRPLGRTSTVRMRVIGFTEQPTLLGATIARSQAEEALHSLAPDASLPATYRTVLVFAEDDRAADALARDLRASGFRATTLSDMLAGVESSGTALTVALALLAGFILLLALLMVVTTMITATIERTGEIGVLRALGARRGDVAWQFLVEALLLGAVGGVLGLGLGLLTAQGAGALLARSLPETRLLGSAFVAQDFIVFLVPLLAGPLVAVLGALAPSLRAANIPPVQALRSLS